MDRARGQSTSGSWPWSYLNCLVAWCWIDTGRFIVWRGKRISLACFFFTDQHRTDQNRNMAPWPYSVILSFLCRCLDCIFKWLLWCSFNAFVDIELHCIWRPYFTPGFESNTSNRYQCILSNEIKTAHSSNWVSKKLNDAYLPYIFKVIKGNTSTNFHAKVLANYNLFVPGWTNFSQ